MTRNPLQQAWQGRRLGKAGVEVPSLATLGHRHRCGLAQAPVEGAGLLLQALGLGEQGTVAAEIETHRKERQGDAGDAHRPQGTKAPPGRLAQARDAVRPRRAARLTARPPSGRRAERPRSRPRPRHESGS
jgi:hypothetical protein